MQINIPKALLLSEVANQNCTTFNPSRPDPGRREKNDLYFYFQTSLWCLKRFCGGLKGLHKTF